MAISFTTGARRVRFTNFYYTADRRGILPLFTVTDLQPR
jgi:hypothetical protein